MQVVLGHSVMTCKFGVVEDSNPHHSRRCLWFCHFIHSATTAPVCKSTLQYMLICKAFRQCNIECELYTSIITLKNDFQLNDSDSDLCSCQPSAQPYRTVKEKFDEWQSPKSYITLIYCIYITTALRHFVMVPLKRRSLSCFCHSFMVVQEYE